MKKLLIGMGTVGTLSAAPVIAYITTHHSNKSNVVGAIEHHDFLTRLRESAANLTQANSQPINFIRNLDNKKESFTTTQGMYDSVKNQLVGRNLILNHHNVYKSEDQTRVVFYYGKGQSTISNPPTNEVFDLFPDQANIKRTLEKDYWGNDLLIDSNAIDAVVIFTIDKNDNVINVASGIRHPDTKVEFQHIEEMVIFETEKSTLAPDVDLSSYIWIPKYGIACDIKSDKRPFRYIFDKNIKLIYGAPLVTTDVSMFTPVKGYPSLLTLIPKEEHVLPFHPQHVDHETGSIVVPILDRETLKIPMLVPEIGDNSAIPIIIPLQKAQSAPTLIRNN